MDVVPADPQGDAWLAAVAANGGKAPASQDHKEFLKEVGNNRWKLVVTGGSNSPHKKARTDDA